MALKEIKYVEAHLDEVLGFFAKGYTFPSGELRSFEAFVDTAKQKVIFKLYVEKETAT